MLGVLCPKDFSNFLTTVDLQPAFLCIETGEYLARTDAAVMTQILFDHILCSAALNS